MSLVTIFRSIRRAELSPLWMPPRPKRSSSGGFATKSTGLKENSLFSAGDADWGGHPRELQTTIAAGVIALEISNQKRRVQALAGALGPHAQGDLRARPSRWRMGRRRAWEAWEKRQAFSLEKQAEAWAIK